MKKIFARYPTLFYQILLLFLLEEIAYSQCSFDLFPLYQTAEFETLQDYTQLTISIIYIISGFIVEWIKDFKKGIIISIILLSIGFLLTTIDYGNYYLFYSIGGFLSEIGHAVFFIFCILHVGMLFPIADDWKDLAFSILLIIPFLGINLKYLFLNSNYDIIINIYSIGFGLFLIAIVLLFNFISQFQHLGFSIETVEENHEKEDDDEKRFINIVMIGIILTSLAFTFIAQNLHGISFYQNNFNGWEEISFHFDRSVPSLLTFFIFSILISFGLLIKFAKQVSTQLNKIFFIITLSSVFGVLHLLFGESESYFFVFANDFIFQLILIPCLLSIMTHINLDQKIGVWIGIFLGIPFFIDQLLIPFFLPEKVSNFFPFIALVLLISFFVAFRENKYFLEKRLELNEPNRADGEENEENDIDLMEHFVDE
ncbi:MAG: hypothetical protein AB8F94_16385 [Saprospiraceae bacterium]